MPGPHWSDSTRQGWSPNQVASECFVSPARLGKGPALAESPWCRESQGPNTPGPVRNCFSFLKPSHQAATGPSV